MSKRFYISKIVGDGTEFNPYRPKVADYDVGFSCVLPNNPDGTPKFPFTFCIVATQDHQPLLNDIEIRGMPELSLDAQISTLSKTVRDKMLAFFDEYGIDRTGLTLQSTMRDVIRRIGTHIAASYNENKFDVKE